MTDKERITDNLGEISRIIEDTCKKKVTGSFKFACYCCNKICGSCSGSDIIRPGLY